ncbi:MAG: hypothetical protein D3924_13165, partial [Candidatus Electrothrix sp. AR4]|nr:hypothetical protein [Candidatus Electrothrix sp. AR4]
AQIVNITTTDPLCVDLDNGVSTYRSLEDLLLVDSFVMRVETPSGLIAGAKKQWKLVANFLKSDLLWEDGEKRQELIDSSKLFGDLRKRKIIIPDLVYTDNDIFYTDALGGVYVLKRPSADDQPETIFIVCKEPDKVTFGGMDNLDVRILPITGKNLLKILRKADFFQFAMQSYQENPNLLKYKKELLLANFICEKETSYSGWTDMKKKNYIARHANEIPNLFFEIERVQMRFAAGKQFYSIPLSAELIAYLTIPHKRIPVIYRSALENLLSELDPGDPVRLFKYNKKRFYQEYNEYPACKKQWVAELLELELGG